MYMYMYMYMYTYMYMYIYIHLYIMHYKHVHVHVHTCTMIVLSLQFVEKWFHDLHLNKGVFLRPHPFSRGPVMVHDGLVVKWRKNSVSRDCRLSLGTSIDYCTCTSFQT